MTQYYVSNSGSNSASGDLGHPFLTIAKGISVLTAGDTLYLRSGTYSESIDSNDYPGSSFPVGTSFSNAVTIASHPGETATIRGPGGDGMINLAHSYLQYIIFDRLLLDGANYNFAVSIPSGGANYIRVSNGEILNTQKSGTLMEGTGNQLLRNLIHECGVDGALDHGTYWTGNDGVIDGNAFYDNAAFGLQLYDGSNFDASRNVIRNNRIYNNAGQGGVTLSAGSDNLFYNNLVYNNGILGVQISSGGPTNQQLYNNTIYNNTGPGILVKSGSSNTVIANNILYNNAGQPVENQGSGTQQSFNVTTNPTFVNAGAANFHLQSTSNCRNTGTTIALVTTDCDGVARPAEGVYCIGAFEFVPVAPPGPSGAFYVSPTGNNAQNGDASHPWRTLAFAIGMLTSGDTLILRGGLYDEAIDQNTTPIPSGTSFSTATTLLAYPGETPILRHEVGDFRMVHMPTGSYIIFDGLTFDGSLSMATVDIGSSGAHHLRFIRCTLKNARGVYPGSTGTGASNAYVSGVGHEFVNCDNFGSAYSYSYYIGSGSGVLIDGGACHDNAGYGIQVYDGGTGGTNYIIRNCRIYNNGFVKGEHAMTIGSGGGHQIYNNLIYDNNGGVESRPEATGNSFWNNTFYNNGYGIFIRGPNTTIRNNIFWQTGQEINNQGGGTSQTFNLTGSDPLFLNQSTRNFHLTSSSPARNTGTTIAQVTNDFDGIPRPQEGTYCRGAYEFLVSAPVTNVQLQVLPSRAATRAVAPAIAGLATGTVAPASFSITRPRISRAKPSLGATLNRRHPLAQQMTHCFIMNEQHGTRLVNLAQPQQIALDANQVEWRSGPSYSGALNARIGPWVLSLNILPAILLSAPWTIETWINVAETSTPGGTDRILLAQGDTNISLIADLSPGTTWRINYYRNGSNLSAKTYPFNTWHHLVVTATGANSAILYMNGREDVTWAPGTTAWTVEYVLGSFFGPHSFAGGMDLLRIWQGRALGLQEVRTLYTNPWGMIDPLRKRPVIMAGLRTSNVGAVRVVPARVGAQATTTALDNPAFQVRPARVAVSMATPRMNRRFTVQPARVTAQFGTFSYLIHILTPPQFILDALAQTFIAGDWLVEIPALDLTLAFAFDPDSTWDHRLLDIGDIEVAVAPGGGMSTVSNVTLRIAETGDTTSLVERWESRGTLAGVQVTISFLLLHSAAALQLYSGVIDSVTVRDAVTEILVVDESIQRNIQIPRLLIDQNSYPASDTSLWTKAQPLVYGKGSHGGALPLLHVDTLRRTYLLAAHPVVIAGNLAVFHPDTSTFMALGDIAQLYTQITSTLTLVTLARSVQEMRFNVHSGGLRIVAENFITNARQAIDGSPTTGARLLTTGTDSNFDGYGELIVAGSATPMQRGNNTVIFQVVNHRRAQVSDATVTGTFSLRTIDALNGATLRDNLFQTQAFRHALTAQTTSFVVTSINLGATENVAVRLLARKEGGPGNATTQYYEANEIGLESFYQPTTDSNIYVQGTGWEGRKDPDGTVTAYHTIDGTGTLLTFPDEIMASLLQQEMGVFLDVATFAQAHSVYAALLYQFDGGIGAGWAVERQSARDVLHALALQSFSILVPSTGHTWLLKPYDSLRLPTQAFDISTILTSEGTTQPGQPGWHSTFSMTLGNLAQVHHHFEVHYAYNVATHKYDKVARVDENDSSLAANIVDKEAMELACQASFALYGLLDPLIFQAHWIYDDVTAALMLRHFVLYFYAQRLGVSFDTTLRGLTLALGDFVTVDYPALPASEQGETFEVHRLQFHPTAGRVSLAASRLVALSAEYFAIKDQNSVTWYFWADRAGQLVRGTTAPVITPFTMVSLIPTPVPFYLRTLDEVGGTWYLYPDTLGELLISSVAPPIGSGVNVGTGQTWKGHTQHTYRLGAQSWGAWTIVQLD